MESTLRSIRSEASANRWREEPPVDATFRPADLNRYGKLSNKGPSRGKRAPRAFVRFLVTFCVGVAATLAWQSYGDVARELIANSSPQLAWLAPHEAIESAPGAVAAATPVATSPDPQRLEAMSLGLSAVRQRLDQLAAQIAFNQQQTVGEFAKLQSIDADILRKMSAPPPQPVAALAHKPVLVKRQPSTPAPPIR